MAPGHSSHAVAPAASRRESPRWHADVSYAGRAFPVLTEILYLKPRDVDGSFRVKRWLADYRGEFGAILEDAERRVWAVYDLDAIEWLT